MMGMFFGLAARGFEGMVWKLGLVWFREGGCVCVWGGGLE